MVLYSRSDIMDSISVVEARSLAAFLRGEEGLCIKCSLLELLSSGLEKKDILLLNVVAKQFPVSFSFSASIGPSGRLLEIREIRV